MKIKLYIITYKNSVDLIANLESIFRSDFEGHDIRISIINNHSEFNLPSHLLSKINVLHNVCRPDFSTGHLSRNWNQAIINGFKNLNNPDCDIVAHCQDDSLFTLDWVSKLVNLHQKYTFVQMGIGDNFCSYLPKGIKHIGLWDERFCGIGYQEADYFLRALIYNSLQSCLNDYQHGRLINNVDYCFCGRPQLPHIFSDEHRKSMIFHSLNEKIFKSKWPHIPPNYWTSEVYNNFPVRSAIDNFIYYPYFEKDIELLPEKRFIV